MSLRRHKERQREKEREVPEKSQNGAGIAKIVGLKKAQPQIYAGNQDP